MPGETGFRDLSAAMAFFRIPARSEDDGWAHTVNARGGTCLALRPGRAGETTVPITFSDAEFDAAATGIAARTALLRRALIGRGTVAERVAAELDGVDNLYAGPMRQVRMSRWSKGRFVLLNDAAYCPTPFTGAGCALALIGTYVLSGEIAARADRRAAFAAYGALVRPHVEVTQRQLNPMLVRYFIHAAARASPWPMGSSDWSRAARRRRC